jgi:(R)-2-hydroxyacyl-CoA dehydratese activating ATPase
VRIEDCVDPALVAEVSEDRVVGFDLGSRMGKAVLLAEGRLFTAITATGIHVQRTADLLLEMLLRQSGLRAGDLRFVVGTGYGRVSLVFEDIPAKMITEINCHAMGVHFLNAGARTILDIGGQDSKAIRIDPDDGRVVEFAMNDKCAAGTGRFLEKAAYLLDMTVEEMGACALAADEPAEISSQCVVFAESEIISLKARGIGPENIAAGVHLATVRRVRNLLNRIKPEPALVFSGGVAKNLGMRAAVERTMGLELGEIRIDPAFGGALGAAILAQRSLSASGPDSVGRETIGAPER